jgi:hypothetical protein
MSGRAIPDAVPEAWIARWQRRANGGPLANRFIDDHIEFPGALAVARQNEWTLRQLREVHGW